MLRKFVVAAALLFPVIVPIARAQDGAKIDQTFFLTFVPNIQFSPLYVGLEKGYFDAAGFNVTIEHGDEPVGTNLIAANERQFGMIGGEQVITARANGLPVVMVYEWFQKFPVGIVAPIETGIVSVEDLRGRRVGIPGRFGASYSGLVAMLAANGMTESDIDLQEIGFNALEVVCVGGVEASVVYINNEPLQISQRAAEDDCGNVTGVNVIPVSAAADMVSNGLVTSEQVIAEHPDWVTNMVAAFDQGLRDSIRNPAEAYLLSASYVENLPLSDAMRVTLEALAEEENTFLMQDPNPTRGALAERRALMLNRLQEKYSADELIQFEVLLATIDLWDADHLGYSDPAAWETTQNTLMLMGFVSEPIDLAQAFTNDFLPYDE